MKDLEIKPISCDSKTAAKALGISLSLFYQLDNEGKIPMGTKLHSKKMYDYSTLVLWSRSGMLSRDSEKWQALLKAEGIAND